MHGFIGAEPFRDIDLSGILTMQQVFVVLYDLYEQKPFIEQIPKQETISGYEAEITFGISDDAFRVDVEVEDGDEWLVEQKDIAVNFSGGFATAIIKPA